LAVSKKCITFAADKFNKQKFDTMKYYDSNSEIKTVEDVNNFFSHVVDELGISIHPDDSFEDYINFETNEQVLPADKCKVYNRIMEQCFDVCDKNDVDIYEIGLNKVMAQMQN